MRYSRVVPAAVVVGLLSSLLLPTGAFAATPAPTPSDDTVEPTAAGSDYAGDPDAEALLVAGEERRIASVRAIANAADWSGAAHYKPYRLATGGLYTLVLVEREAPYTIDDLVKLAPKTFARQPDRSYLLSENIVVDEGATLLLKEDDGLTLHLASNEDSFVSIVTLGGSLTIEGTPDEPATVSSWNLNDGKTDSDTTDGRAFIRVVSGHAELANATFDHLGFWSGGTGGVSLTGTDALDIDTEDLATGKDQREAAIATDTAVPEIYGNELLPADGEAEELPIDADLTSYSYVSATIQNVVFSNNAFGLFVTSAEGVVIRDSEVKNSLVDGIIMHRFVTNSEITRTSSHDNVKDGFRLTRGTSGIVLDRLTAKNNGFNGISLNGKPLAEGPSATGTSVGSYGNNEVANSTSSNNGRYGIEVLGGTSVQVDSNQVDHNVMGIVIGAGAEGVVVKNNMVEENDKQGIALRTAGTDAAVTGNTVVGGEIGIYARDAGGTFERNTVERVSNHAITLIGDTGASVINKNTVSGAGPSAIDVARTDASAVSDNDADEWRSTKPLGVILRGFFQPLTVMWLLLALLLVVSALSSIGRNHNGFRHPYASLAPLSSYTKGVIDRESLESFTPRAQTGQHS